jgi:deoxyribodipyrimidine photo-lyase
MHDNYLLHHAVKQAAKSTCEVLPVFCFDPRYYNLPGSKTKYGTRKCGAVRARFMLETVSDLRKSFQAIGSNLLVTNSKPEEYLPTLLDVKAQNHVLFTEEVTKEELEIENAVKASLAAKGNDHAVSFSSLWGLTLHHLADLDYDPKEYLPHIYGKFRERNAAVKVRALVPTP